MIFDEVERFVAECSEGDTSVRPDQDVPGRDPEFDRLALAVFAHQYEHVPLYRRLCDLRGRTPQGVQHWSEVPAAPADLFKEDLGLEDGLEDGSVNFLSSGTTQGAERRSRHPVNARSYELYRRSSMAHFRSMVLPDRPGPMAVLVLGPLATTHPASSLGHMHGFVVDAFAARGDDGAPDAAHVFDAGGALDLAAALAHMEAAAASTRPLLVLALSSTITAVFEALRDRKAPLRLPADSRLVETGGSKGGRTMSRAGILKAAWRFLHIPSYLCMGEYGMTELLSQFYDDAWHSRWSGALQPRSKVGPRWMRTLVVDPATLQPLPAGERGILRHFDLANVGSVSAVQTLDVGRTLGAGIEVTGRATGAEARGCSQLMSALSEGITRS
jgi:hypothetical protein